MTIMKNVLLKNVKKSKNTNGTYARKTARYIVHMLINVYEFFSISQLELYTIIETLLGIKLFTTRSPWTLKLLTNRLLFYFPTFIINM